MIVRFCWSWGVEFCPPNQKSVFPSWWKWKKKPSVEEEGSLHHLHDVDSGGGCHSFAADDSIVVATGLVVAAGSTISRR